MIRVALAILLVAVIALSVQDNKVEPICSASTGGSSMTATGTRWAEEFGKTLDAVSKLADDTVTPESWDEWKGNLWDKVLGLWWESLLAGVEGKKVPPSVMKLRDEQAEAELAAQMKCAAQMKNFLDCLAQGGVAAPKEETVAPFDPKTASLRNPSSETGSKVAAAALRAAGFPEAEIPMGVAVAKYETGWRNVSGPTVDGGTMRGMWQINDGAHPQLMQLGDWRDPYVNAQMAYEVWKDAKSWKPWSTWRTAQASLGNSKPEVPVEPAAPPVCDPAGSSSSSSGVTDPGGKTYNLGPVKPQTQRAANILGHRFNVDVIGGYRQDAIDQEGHPAGLAIDLMVSKTQGDQVAAYAKANASALSVEYIIWDQRIWSVARDSEGWRPMSDRGSVSANHKDHVHITFTKSSSVAAASGVVWPVPGRDVGTYKGHDGVDINRGSGNADMGDPIVAAAGGVVTHTGTGRGYGEAVFIQTDSGYRTVYGHTSRIDVSIGQRVVAGEKIGEVGNTGNSSHAHLHFGVFPGGTYAAAMAFLQGGQSA